MNLLRFKRRAVGVGLAAVAFAAPAAVLPGCTDLTEETFGVVRPDQFFRTEAEVTAALAPVYANLRQMMWAYHNLSQVSSDETIVPTRGSDWADGGRWLAMHRHTWDPGLVDLNDAWVAAYTGVARANGLLQNLETVDVPNKDALVAEVRTLRAFYYYQLLDLFGNVPIVGDEAGEYLADPDNPPPTESRAAVYAFVEKELTEARATLPDVPAQTGRVTKASADAMLANLYINGGVFTKNSSGISSTGYNSCLSTAGGESCSKAIAAVDRIIASGRYRLVDDWFSNFTPTNENNPEHLFVVQHLARDPYGLTFAMRYLHYTQLDPGPWNGFSTIAETYNAFPNSDKRKDIFLVGQQKSFETGATVNDRAGNPLVFTPECGDITNTSESACVRVAKFSPDAANNDGGNHGNDYPFFRLAEMYLIKAEALNEQGNVGAAVPLVNALRERVYDAADPTSPPLAQFLLTAANFNQTTFRARLLDERLFELIYEAKRRQDLVRFGEFDDPTQYKPQSAGFRVLFPIPQVQRDANPNLTQNPGY